MSTTYDVEIYDENEFKEKYPALYTQFIEELEKQGGSIEDFEFTQFSQFDVSNGTFFLSYSNVDNDNLVVTLEGELEEVDTYRFEIETD